MNAKKPANTPTTVVAHDPDDRKGRLKNIGGSQSDHWNNILANQAVQALWLKNSSPEERERQLTATVAALAGIAPKDELEGMMAAQLVAAHNAAMECYRRAMIGEQTFEGRRENLAQANKLSRTYAALLEALNRHRGKGQQKVTVEHVHVHAGGQAVVGMVATAPGQPGGYRPELGRLDRDGNEVEDRIYNAKDFDRHIVLDDRTVLTAKKITEFLKESGDRYQKTIVFCVDQEHAARMRQALVNENADLVAENQRYVMRITGSDKEGQEQLGNFIDPESKYPVLVTTSRLLSTGIDAQTCRLIVLDREVHSMTEFKQIVGRGTRVHEDTKKFFFTLIDFRGATSHFADPDFDGPVQIYEPGEGDPIAPPDNALLMSDNAIPLTPGEDETVVDQPDLPLPPGGLIRKIYVDGVGARILAERVEYLDENGKLVTESLRDFTKTALKKRFASLDDFLKRWKSAERKQAIVEELEAEGLALDIVVDELGKNLDPFDLICHIAFDKKPLTRRERADNVKKRDVFTKYGGRARAVLDALLEKYRDEGMLNLDDTNVLLIPPLNSLGTRRELLQAFGGRMAFEQAVREMQDAIYQESA